MSDVQELLLASLHPETRKQAEQSLAALSQQQGFLVALLQLVLSQTTDRAARLSGSVYLKNTVRRRWDEEERPVSAEEKATLRAQLVPAMITLADSSDRALRSQIAETISTIADYDFPREWEDLVNQLVNALTPEPGSYATNLAILETAHSIFGRWRSEMRSDELYTTINFVVSRFADPFLRVMRYTAGLLLNMSLSNGKELEAVAQTMVVLLHLFYDLACQDIPPALEDTHSEIFGPESGLFVQFLKWDPADLKTDADEPSPSIPSQIKTAIFELAELYTHRFSELLAATSTIEVFTPLLWDMLGGGRCDGIAYDQLVSQALRFLGAAIRSGQYRQLFTSQSTIAGLIEGVVVPNVTLRTHEVEQFEDDPLEFVRVDLSFAGAASAGAGAGGFTAEGTTRRQAAADMLRALVVSGSESYATEVVLGYVARGLQDYAAAPQIEDKWKRKDESVYLFTAVATRGATAQQGVTSTNPLVNVVQFFSQNIFHDLQPMQEGVHPILQVDAIRFLYSFRNQLTKEQLLAVLPLLQHHLRSPNYVCYTYAAITIERILSIKRESRLLFNQEDIRNHALDIINLLLSKIEAGGTPEKIAENDYLMKCVMRVILTARTTIAIDYETLLQRLIRILGAIAKNPSNPNFDQYIFESISALIRYTVAASSHALANFEQNLFGPISIILQQDIDQFIPYAFQIVAQMLELHKGDVPDEYRQLLPILLQPASWSTKGSIPALVRLLKAFIRIDAAQLAITGQFTGVLAVVQQKLIPSKINDAWGMELLQALIQYIPKNALGQYMKTIITMLLTRLQTARTDTYVYGLVYFILFSMAIDAEGLSPDFIIGAVEQVQPRLWSQLLEKVFLPQLSKTLPKDKNVVIVGLTKMLARSSIMMTDPSITQWPPTFAELVKLFGESSTIQSAQATTAEDPDEVLRSLDFEEQGVGYQAAYSKLATSEGPPVDPVAVVGDLVTFVRTEVSQAFRREPRRRMLVEHTVSNSEIVAKFVQDMISAGYQI